MSIFHCPTTTDQDGPSLQDSQPDSEFGQCDHCGRPLTFSDHVEFLASWLIDLYDENSEEAVAIADLLFDELDEASPDEKK